MLLNCSGLARTSSGLAHWLEPVKQLILYKKNSVFRQTHSSFIYQIFNGRFPVELQKRNLSIGVTRWPLLP